MKIGVVSPEQIEASSDLRLDAAYYLDPTAKIDRQIAQAERSIKATRARLRRLRSERKKLLERKAKEP
jgi:hypothetical protein